jgi:hypothetical protein
MTVTYGDWLPTLYLRLRKDMEVYGREEHVVYTYILQQRMRRRVKQFPVTGPAYTLYEYSWKDVPKVPE